MQCVAITIIIVNIIIIVIVLVGQHQHPATVSSQNTIARIRGHVGPILETDMDSEQE